MLLIARQGARTAEVAFDLDRADIFIPVFCPVLGLRLRFDGARNVGDDGATLDRLIPELGYVRGNVAVISHKANRLKNNGTAEEHDRIAAWMRSRGAR